MPKLALITFYFLAVAFTSDVPQGMINPFTTYYLIQWQFISQRGIFVILIFALLSAFFLIFNLKKPKHIFQRFLRFLRRLLAIVAGGSVAAFLALFVIAYIELNVLSILTRINPKILGIVSDPQKIVENLKKNTNPPAVAVGGEEDLLLPAIATAQSGKESFYGARIVQSIPPSFLLPMKKSGSGVLQIGNTLIVSKIDSPEFQQISPVVSYLFINSYFRNRNIKHYPKVSLMGKDEYNAFRIYDFEKKLEVIEEVIAKIDEEIPNLRSGISEQEEKVIETETVLSDQKKQRQKQYTSCVNEGSYVDGKYIRSFNKDECTEKMAEYDENIKTIQQELDDINNSLGENKEKLSNYQQYQKYYESQKILTREESSYVSYEFASFTPPDEIKISLTLEDDPLTTADYFELMIHEYLHYATYDEDSSGLASNFFMEGLTEYFARNIIKENLGVDTNIGYPAAVAIIEQMMKRIAERDIADAYFAGDQKALVELMDLVYGEGFYDDNIVDLETLQYTSDTAQILKLANGIMDKIGGDYITEDDLKTSYSSFR